MNAISSLVDIEYEEVEEILDEIETMEDVTDEYKQEMIKETKERFKVRDLSTANWVFKKLVEIKKEEKERQEFIDSEKKKLDDWFMNENKKVSWKKAYFESLLIEYQKENEQQDPKFKVSTPHGYIKRTRSKPWDYGDEEKLKDTLKDLGFDYLIRTKEELNKPEIKKNFKVTDDFKVVTPDGEIIDDIKVTEKTTYTVKLD